MWYQVSVCIYSCVVNSESKFSKHFTLEHLHIKNHYFYYKSFFLLLYYSKVLSMFWIMHIGKFYLRISFQDEGYKTFLQKQGNRAELSCVLKTKSIQTVLLRASFGSGSVQDSILKIWENPTDSPSVLPTSCKNKSRRVNNSGSSL